MAFSEAPRLATYLSRQQQLYPRYDDALAAELEGVVRVLLPFEGDEGKWGLILYSEPSEGAEALAGWQLQGKGFRATVEGDTVVVLDRCGCCPCYCDCWEWWYGQLATEIFCLCCLDFPVPYNPCCVSCDIALIAWAYCYYSCCC